MKRILYIGNKLAAHGNTPTAIEVLGPMLEIEGFQVKYASAKENKIARMIEMLWLTISRQKKTDYVIIDTYSTSNFWYAFLVSQACRIFEIQYIPILHGGALPRRLANNPKACAMIFKHSYANVAPSGFLKKAFESAGFHNVIYIPNPVELLLFPFKKRSELAAKLLWVRSLSPIYNPKMALKVAHALKPDLPNVRLAMVGPDKAGMMQQLVKCAREWNVHCDFIGKKTKKEWAILSADYDIFINTSRVDNAPYSLIEAAALGLPIISTNVGGIPYLFKDNLNAILVNENDVEAMADAVKNVIRNKELRERIISGGLELSEGFLWDKVKYQWLEILK